MIRIHQHSQTVDALNAQGCLLCEQAEFSQALATFDQAIALDSRHCTVWSNRGNALCGLGRYADALAAYDKAVALNPQYHQAWFNRGRLLAEMGAYGNAIESYHRAIALEADPRYLHAKEDIWLKGQLVATV
ncbi:MAG: tetratricopeptide repeat protein [Leptolyngbyaceae cyanobacterium SM2_5_2]|nr:tetratricopeptide repeat protein [Leptolyngbyaceae cyanobacterium SM2_5_2]